jgi:hypothetical protein
MVRFIQALPGNTDVLGATSDLGQFLIGAERAGLARRRTRREHLGKRRNRQGPATWAPPTINGLGAQSLPLTLTLTPWSMNVVIIK